MTPTTSVLIVGGSLNGLTAALLLAHRRGPCVVVERHPQTTLHTSLQLTGRAVLSGRRSGSAGMARASFSIG